MTDEMLNNAMGMAATGVGIGLLGMGAGVLIKSIGNLETNAGMKTKRAAKRKTKKRKK